MIANILLFIIVFTIAFLIRIYLLYKYKWVGIDTFYNLLIAKNIRKIKKLPESINNFVYPEKYDYPPLFHVLLSLFKEETHQKLQLLSPISDMLSGICIFIFCNIFYNYNIAIMAMLIYFFTPIIYDISYSLTPRSIANLFMIISLFSLYSYYIYNSYIMIFISILFSSFVLLTHRLTSQSLVFVLIILSICLKSVIPLYILIISVIFAVIITKGFYFKVLKGHLKFVTILGSKIFDKNLRKQINNVFPNPIYILFNIPLIVTVPFLLYYNDNVINYFVIWGTSIIVLSVIWVFGEGVRHLSNAIPALAISIAVLVYESRISNIVFIFILIISIVFLLYKIYRIEKLPNTGNFINEDTINAFNYIKHHKKSDDILLCLPVNFSYVAAYFTDCVILQSSGGFAKGLDYNQKLIIKIKEKKIDYLIKEYNVIWIVIINKNMETLNTITYKELYKIGEVNIIKTNNNDSSAVLG